MKPIRYRLRHYTPRRTRLQFPLLKGQITLCRSIESRLCEDALFTAVTARPKTGSIIFEHHKGVVRTSTLVEKVEKILASGCSREHTGQPEKKSGLAEACCASSLTTLSDERPVHVGGTALVLSGLYLLYLSVKRIFGVVSVPATFAARVFTLPAVVAFGLSIPIQRQAIEKLKKNGKPDMSLISVGLLYVSIFMGNVLAALTIFWLFNLSSWLENRIRIKTRTAVRAMLTGNVQTVWLLEDGVEIEAALETVVAGDLVSFRLGDVISVDGRVIDGEALINESSITGESLPASKTVDDLVFAGTCIEEGHIVVQVEKAGEETRLAAIIDLIEEGENTPGELQRMSERFSQMMVPVALSIAGLALLFTGNLLQATAVLIITCPCAIRLSTSVAVSSGMSVAASRGIFIKGGTYLELIGNTNVLVLDKTGTITDRASEICGIEVFDRRYREDSLLALAAAVQKSWKHPLSRAITAFTQRKNLTIPECQSADLVVSRGVIGAVEGSQVLVGSRRFMDENQMRFPRNIVLPDVDEKGGAVSGMELFIAKNGKVLGRFVTRSQAREDSITGLARLKRMKIDHLVVLTGDTSSGVRGWEDEFGFDVILSEQSPEDKARWIREWKEHNPDDVVAMVGDGINDTPAFAVADVSLAIGDGGADVTLEYADIVLQKGNIDQVAEVLDIGREALQRMRKSYAIALAANGTLLFLTTFGWISSVTGALLHNLTTLVAVSNAALPPGKKEQRINAEEKIGLEER